MKKLVLTATAVVAMSAASFAMAGGMAQAQSQAKHSGFYVGGGIGYANIDVPKASLVGDFDKVTNDFGWFTANAHAGYLIEAKQNFLLGAEVAYNYLPQLKTSYTNKADKASEVDKLNSYTIDFLGVAKYYVSDEFNVFAKAGGSYLHHTAEEVSTNTAGDETKDSTTEAHVKPKLAVGAGYMVMPQLELTAEYSHTFGTNFKDPDDVAKANSESLPSNDTVLAGLNYYFN